jgi:hypothetical protein
MAQGTAKGGTTPKLYFSSNDSNKSMEEMARHVACIGERVHANLTLNLTETTVGEGKDHFNVYLRGLSVFHFRLPRVKVL